MSKLYCLFVMMLCWCAISGNLAAQSSGIPPGNNIAKGKKYTLSAPPTKAWQKSLKSFPDCLTILTDGIIEDNPEGAFWLSEKCANFNSSINIDVIIDLEKESPIAAIKTRHGASPDYATYLPNREEYFVSDDGVKFYKVGEFKNTFDDHSIKNEREIKKKFASGIKEYGVNGLKAKGRYVMVRTYGSGLGNTFANYVGYDEIFVIEGVFPLSEATRDESSVIEHKRPDIPSDMLGYRMNPPDIQKLTLQYPLYLALAPNQFIGDNEFHLSVDGVHVMTFSPLIGSAKTVTDVKFECELPASIELLGYSKESKLNSTDTVTRNGKPYLKYSFIIPKLTDFSKSYMDQLYLIVRSKDISSGKPGDGYYQYFYAFDGKKYDHADSFTLIVDPKISAPAPKRFITGFWLPYQARFASNTDSIDKLIGFYNSLGFNCQNGGNRSPESSKACRRNGMTVYGGSGFNNGMMFSGEDIPENERFTFHPQHKGNFRLGVCPTLLYTSPKYTDMLKQKISKALTESDHIYSNWEPYMFMKQGCICERCKNEFQKFGKLSNEDLAKIWPGCTIDEDNQLHNSFSSYQYATIIKLAQKITRAANSKANFLVAYEPSFVDPEKLWSKYHAHGDFYRDIDMTVMWAYPNTLSLYAADIKMIPGNSLAELPDDFSNARKIAEQSGRKDGDTVYPKIFFMGTEYMFNFLVMPRDFYFMSLLCFFDRLDGYGTWSTHFKSDARFIALNARANTVISEFENVILDGRKKDNAKATIVSPVPASINDKKLNLSIVRSFEYQGRELVAVGNDYVFTIYVKLAVSGLADGKYRLYDAIGRNVYQQDADNGYTAQALAAGVLIPVKGKEWAVLKLDATSGKTDGYTICTQADIEKRFAQETPALQAALAYFR